MALLAELADFHAKGGKSQFKHTETVVKTERDLFGDTAFRSTMYGFDLQATEKQATEKMRSNGGSMQAEAGEDIYQAAATLLRSCRNIVFFTGAGISAESGIPTYRDGPNAIWDQYDPYQIGSIAAFLDNAGAVWDKERAFIELLKSREPNVAHHAIAKLEEENDNLSVTVITQNIDGLHQKAGSSHVIEIHGGQGDGAVCMECAEAVAFEDLGLESLPPLATPRCPTCGGIMKPNTISFDQDLDGQVLGECIAHMKDCDAIVIVGTSAVVSPAREMPFLAKVCGAKVVVVNPKETHHFKAADVCVLGNGSALDDIFARM